MSTPTLITRTARAAQKAIRRPLTDLVRLQTQSSGPGLRVNGWSRINAPTFLGSDVHFNGIRILGVGEVRIGSHFHSGKDVLMISQVHDYLSPDQLPYGPELLPRPISIGDFVWLGDRVTILGGAVIGDGAIIQAGSVVVGEVPELAIAGGHPATPFRFRDRKRFDAAKQSMLNDAS